MVKFEMHVFSGRFDSANSARSFCDKNYEDETRLPESEFMKEFDGLLFDEDFLEVIHGEKRLEYLETMLIDSDDLNAIQSTARPDDNTFILILGLEENRGLKIPNSETERIQYCGAFRACFRDDI